MWTCERVDDDHVQVWPLEDAIAHDLDGTGCVCGPLVEIQPNGVLLVSHASLDGRELLESL